MPHDPADIGRRPENLALTDAIDMRHAPGDGHRMAADAALPNDPFKGMPYLTKRILLPTMRRAAFCRAIEKSFSSLRLKPGNLYFDAVHGRALTHIRFATRI